MLLALVTAALAADVTTKDATSLVVGANVAVLLGAPPPGTHRVGFGLDLYNQTQLFREHGQSIYGNYWVWAEERPMLNFGPALHVWRVGGAWSASADMRVGVTWPLRMGLMDGWWPGPGLTVEVGPGLSTAGYAGLDLQGAVDLPWVQGRIGSTYAGRALQPWRLHLGVFSPLEQPHLWPDSDGAIWDLSDVAP